MSNHENGRRIVLTPDQKREIAELQNPIHGFTYAEARYYVLTPEQKEIQKHQVREAERRRFENNPYEELIKRARYLRKSACKRGAKRGAWEFTITVDDLKPWPDHCPVFPWIELHYRGHYRGDPAGASLDRIDHSKGYVPGNVRVVSLRANFLRKNMTSAELFALALFLLPRKFLVRYHARHGLAMPDDHRFRAVDGR